jgi:hypothetical protein
MDCSKAQTREHYQQGAMDRKEGMAMEEWSRNRYAWMKQ